MTAIEINLDVASKIAAAQRALENGWISKAQYDEKVRHAYEWKRKAECGHWDRKAYKAGA